jgi:amino-acid N-acetyltransferase
VPLTRPIVTQNSCRSTDRATQCVAPTGPEQGSRSSSIRAARLSDVPDIVTLINGFAAQQVMLPKSAESVLLALDDFIVATDKHGRVVGCAAVREYSPSLAEVASVAVAPEAHGLGIGAALVRRVERLAAARGTAELFALTTTAPFFQSLGYRVVDRALFPEKIRRDCVGCPRRSACVEVCVYRSLAAAQQQAA